MTTRRNLAGAKIPNPAPRSASSTHNSAPSPPAPHREPPPPPPAPPQPTPAQPAADPAPPAPAWLGYTFKNPALLTLALTHSSLAYESKSEAPHATGSDNEQLEFIGDAVLGLVVAEALFRRFPALREGDLTRMRASLVSSRNLADVAQRLQLGAMLHLGRGEQTSGGRGKPALLANALEAVIAAMYLDGGLAPAADFILRHIIEPAQAGLSGVLHSSVPFAGAIGDYKSALQERLQAAGLGQPQYILTDQSGPDHRKRFRIQARIAAPDGRVLILAEADGTTKKLAQQEAARLAFAALLESAPSLPASLALAPDPSSADLSPLEVAP